jgi:hypothetical protein
MKLKHDNLVYDIKLELCDGGVQITLPVESLTEDLFGLGLSTTPNYLIKRFVATNKKDVLKLVGEALDDLYVKA